MEVLQRLFSRTEQYFLLVNKLNNIEGTPTRETVMQGVKESVAEASMLDLQDANTLVKSAFSASWRWI